jgi:hypothetical protein
MANQIMVIKPYKWSGMWVFDDPAVGLEREAFVGGADLLIDKMVERENIRDAESGFLLIFSKDPFPGSTFQFKWLRKEGGGDIYEAEGQEGWLCPALYKYFEAAPASIHIQAKAVTSAGKNQEL